MQVERQRHQGPFGVVAHGGVGAVFVDAVVLGPSLEAGLGQAVHQPAGAVQHLIQGFGEQLQVAGFVDQAGAQQQQVVEVAGEAFEQPQQLGVLFAVVVVTGVFGRAQALDVPSVKVFVADQAQQAGVAVAGAKRGCLGGRWGAA